MEEKKILFCTWRLGALAVKTLFALSRLPTAWPRAFTHPLWWGALGLLALNDHVLKGSGVLAGSWTGKLSDFAGMVVAPPLLACLFGARRRWAAPVAALLVGAGLCAIDLFPAVSHALERVLAACGLPSRLWPDPSDLWALVILPLGYALGRVPADQPVRRSAATRATHAGAGWPQRMAIALGACACLATAGIDDDEGGGGSLTDAPEVENATKDTLVLVVAASDGAGGCVLYRDDRIGALSREAFSGARVVTLEPGDRTKLASNDDVLDCGAASLRLPDGTEEFVYWSELKKIASFVSGKDDRRVARRVVIEGSPNRWELHLGNDLDHFDVDQPPPAAECNRLDAMPTLEFTPLKDAQGFFRLLAIRVGEDGCRELDWVPPENDTLIDTQRLCVPDWAFPFDQGETLIVTQQISAEGARVLQIARLDDGKLANELVVWNDVAEAKDGRVTRIEPINCIGVTSECGAYIRPLELTVKGHDETLRTGDDVEINGKKPKRTRVLAGPGTHVAWPAPACGDDGRVGTRASLLELRSY